MSKSIVKKALEMLDDDDDNTRTKTKKKSKSHSKSSIKKKPMKMSLITDRKQMARACLTLKKVSSPVVTSAQIEQLNNYRFGGPSKHLKETKKKEIKEDIFTEEDFKRFEREYNPPPLKS